MDNEPTAKPTPVVGVPWHPLLGVVTVLVVFYAAQIIAGLLLSIYPSIKHLSSSQATNWLNNSVNAQFFFILLAESLSIYAIYRFVKHYKLGLDSIGLKKPRWSDVGFGLLALPAYFFLYLVTVAVVSYFVPSLNVSQNQDIGFTNVYGVLAMTLTFISLVILPPLAEEIMVRGLLYSSLKKGLKLIPAALITSLIFAAAHLPEGGSAGPLYIAALDTFILSLVLIYLREKTGSLWASITLHACKNGVAFIALFVLHAR